MNRKFRVTSLTAALASLFLAGANLSNEVKIDVLPYERPSSFSRWQCKGNIDSAQKEVDQAQANVDSAKDVADKKLQ